MKNYDPPKKYLLEKFGVEVLLTVSIHTSPVFRESPKPEAIPEHEPSSRKYSLKQSIDGTCVHRLLQCGGCGKYSHKLFLNPGRSPLRHSRAPLRELPPDTQVDSQRVDTRYWTLVDGIGSGQSRGGQGSGHWTRESGLVSGQLRGRLASGCSRDKDGWRNLLNIG